MSSAVRGLVKQVLSKTHRKCASGGDGSEKHIPSYAAFFKSPEASGELVKEPEKRRKGHGNPTACMQDPGKALVRGRGESSHSVHTSTPGQTTRKRAIREYVIPKKTRETKRPHQTAWIRCHAATHATR